MNGKEELYVDDLERVIFLLELLDKACPKHRSYRARRSPQVMCSICIAMYSARVELKEIVL